MANKIKINATNVKKLNKSIPQYWDDLIPGFGIRNNRTCSTYIYKYRNKYGQPHTVTIGRVGLMTPEEARQEAHKHVIAVRKGEDPAKGKKVENNSTIAEICDLYIECGCTHKKQSTIDGDKGRIETIIKPLVGKMPIASFTHIDAQKMLNDIISGEKIRKRVKLNKAHAVSNVKGGEGAASRTMQLFSAIMNFAVINEIIEKNPAIGLKKPKSKKREEHLNEEEIIRLGHVMSMEENLALYSKDINAIKLLMLTGCRKGEILSLKWQYVNFEEHCFNFPDTKTGAQRRPFGKAAENLLLQIKQNKLSDSDYVFPGIITGTHLSDVRKRLKEFLHYKDKEGNLYITTQNICVHSLRHTFASMAGHMKYPESIIAGLLGHKLDSVTSRYTHTVYEDLVEAATEVSGKINDLLQGIK